MTDFFCVPELNIFLQNLSAHLQLTPNTLRTKHQVVCIHDFSFLCCMEMLVMSENSRHFLKVGVYLWHTQLPFTVSAANLNMPSEFFHGSLYSHRKWHNLRLLCTSCPVFLAAFISAIIYVDNKCFVLRAFGVCSHFSIVILEDAVYTASGMPGMLCLGLFFLPADSDLPLEALFNFCKAALAVHFPDLLKDGVIQSSARLIIPSSKEIEFSQGLELFLFLHFSRVINRQWPVMLAATYMSSSFVWFIPVECNLLTLYSLTHPLLNTRERQMTGEGERKCTVRFLVWVHGVTSFLLLVARDASLTLTDHLTLRGYSP